MASALVLMKKNGEEMNVPEGKVAAYLADGWVEFSRTYVDSDAVASEAAEEALEPQDKKPKGKSKS